MEKIEENNLNKKNNNLDETIVIKNLNEMVKKAVKEEKKHQVKSIESYQSKGNQIDENNKNFNSVKNENNLNLKKESVATAKNETKNETNSNIIKEAEKVVNNAQSKELQKVKQPKNKKALIVLLVIMIIMILGIFFSTIFGFVNMNNTKIMNGVFVNGINISNLTKQEAIEELNKTINNNEQNYVTMYRNGVTDFIHLEDIGGSFNAENAVDEAYKIGRQGNIFKCNYEILSTSLFKKSVKTNIQYDKEKLKHKIDETSLKMPDIALSSSYVINENNVIIKNSKAGYKIKEDEFEKNMVDAFSNETKKFEIPVEEVEKEKIDIKKIHEEVFKEAKDAYYTTNPNKIYKEESGIDFAISVAEAEKMLTEEKEEYVIPLKEIKPSIKVSDLDKGAFPDQLSTFTTSYGTGDSGRCHNIYLAAKSITETVVMPGETFSFNDLIGECSTKTGYRESTIYLNGELSTGIGGGICQVSTTLYNAVLRANLEIVKRRNHSLSVTYVPLGQDAMVSIGTSDFQFKNNRDYPIKVVASTATGSITCQIYGLKNNTEYDIKLETKVISKNETNTKTETYKIMYLDGKEVSRTLLSTDTYKNH